MSKIKPILIILITFVISLNTHAQKIKELEGKQIIIPGRNPVELIYHRHALEKNSFKDKFHYNGNICNKPIHISSVYTINKGKSKAALIVEFELGTDSLILRFPKRIKMKDRKILYYDRNYYPLFSRNPHSSYDDNLTADFEDFRIPHYFCSDIDYIKNNILGKSFYSKQGHVYELIQFNNLVLENDSSYSISYKYVDSEKERKKQIAKYQKGDHLFYFTSSNNRFEYFENQDNTFFVSNFNNDYISRDSLIAKAKQGKTYNHFFKIKDTYLDKEVHIDDIYFDSYPRTSFSINDKKAISKITDGIYLVKDFTAMLFQEKSDDYPIASTYLIIAPREEPNNTFAISISKEDFDNKVLLIDAYKQKLREQRIAEIEREKQEQAEEKAKHLRLVKRFGVSNAKLIEDGVIRLGFTKAMVEESWGMPQDITTVTNYMGSIECWVYGIGSYIYFRGGKVVQIIN